MRQSKDYFPTDKFIIFHYIYYMRCEYDPEEQSSSRSNADPQVRVMGRASRGNAP